MIYFEVALPPAKKGLYVPAKLINLGNFFSRQVIPVGCYPAVLAV